MSDFQIDLVKFLKLLKLTTGITSTQISNSCGFSKNTITYWKKGGKPQKSHLETLLKYLAKIEYKYINDDEGELIQSFQSLKFTCYILSKQNQLNEVSKKYNLEHRREFHLAFNNMVTTLEKLSQLTINEIEFSHLQALELANLIPFKYKNSIPQFLAEKFGVSKGQISKWRNGKEFPSEANLEKIKIFCDLPNLTALTTSFDNISLNENFSSFLKSPDLESQINDFIFIYKNGLLDYIFNYDYTQKLSKKIVDENFIYLNLFLDTKEFYAEKSKIIEGFNIECIHLLNDIYSKLFYNIGLSFIEWIEVNLNNDNLKTTMEHLQNKNIRGVYELGVLNNESINVTAENIDYLYSSWLNYSKYQNSYSKMNDWVSENLDSIFYILLFKFSKQNMQLREEWINQVLKSINVSNLHRPSKNRLNLFNDLYSTHIKNNDETIVLCFFKQFWALLLLRINEHDYSPYSLENYIDKVEQEMILSESLNLIFEVIKDYSNLNILPYPQSEDLDYLLSNEHIFRRIIKEHNSSNWYSRFESEEDFDYCRELTFIIKEIL